MGKNDDRSTTEGTKRLIGALLRQPPKPHAEMKIGKKRPKATPAKGSRKHDQKI
jgi:hypothetical protein